MDFSCRSKTDSEFSFIFQGCWLKLLNLLFRFSENVGGGLFSYRWLIDKIEVTFPKTWKLFLWSSFIVVLDNPVFDAPQKAAILLDLSLLTMNRGSSYRKLFLQKSQPKGAINLYNQLPFLLVPFLPALPKKYYRAKQQPRNIYNRDNAAQFLQQSDAFAASLQSSFFQPWEAVGQKNNPMQ